MADDDVVQIRMSGEILATWSRSEISVSQTSGWFVIMSPEGRIEVIPEDQASFARALGLEVQGLSERFAALRDGPVADTRASPADSASKVPVTNSASMDAEVNRLIGQRYRVDERLPGRIIMSRTKAINHVLHGILGLFTCGIWWWVWLGLGVSYRDSRVELFADKGRIQTRVLSGARPLPPGKMAFWFWLVIWILIANVLVFILFAIASGGR